MNGQNYTGLHFLAFVQVFVQNRAGFTRIVSITSYSSHRHACMRNFYLAINDFIFAYCLLD